MAVSVPAVDIGQRLATIGTAITPTRENAMMNAIVSIVTIRKSAYTYAKIFERTSDALFGIVDWYTGPMPVALPVALPVAPPVATGWLVADTSTLDTDYRDATEAYLLRSREAHAIATTPGIARGIVQRADADANAAFGKARYVRALLRQDMASFQRLDY